jgi:hypothetical protein
VQCLLGTAQLYQKVNRWNTSNSSPPICAQNSTIYKASLLWYSKSLYKPIGRSNAHYKQVYFMYSVGQHSFIILIYVIFGQPGEWTDTNVQIEAPLNENMDMISAVHRAFFLGIFPKIRTLMVTFLGQPVRRNSRLVISFYGAIWKRECFRHVRETYKIPN